ncbi:MAG: hypothetical protein O2975_09235 [Proteobacteria bacterium]|nr:hypothetical protein [Pseudomonadota bacterium]
MAGVDARWMRLGLLEPLALHASCNGLAAVQTASDAPIVLWAQANSAVCLGTGLAAPQVRAAVPGRRASPGDLVWVDAKQHVFVLIAPLRFAPGRPARWVSWALAPVIATYRLFGLPAYVNGEEIWLHGRSIAGSRTASIGTCAVIASSFLPCLHAARLADSDRAASADFHLWLREGLSLESSERMGAGALPMHRDLEETFRERISSHYGWRFESDWPTSAEALAIDKARRELEAPIAV